jgi:hypothetical protein
VTLPSCRAGRWLAVLVLVGLALAGCERSSSPQQELRDAFARTLDEDLAFALSTRVEGASLDGPDAETAAFLGAVRLTGVRQQEGPYAAVLDIGGTDPLVEVRGGGGEPLLLRTGFGALLGAEGDPAAELGPRLDELGIGQDERDALVAGFAGDWIAVSDADDVGDLTGPALGATDRAGDGTDAASDPGSDDASTPLDAGRLLAALEVTSARDVGEVRRFDVVLDADVWLGTALGDAVQGGGVDVPSQVPGTVTVRDGLVHEVRLHLADQDDDARLELVLVLREHGEVTFPGPVRPVAEVTVAELVELVAVLDGSAAATAGTTR